MAKDFRQGRRVAYLQALGALGGWSLGILGIYSLGLIYGKIAEFRWFDVVVVPLLLCGFSLLNVRFQILRKMRIKGRYQTLLLYNVNWLWAIDVSTKFPQEFNAYCCLELFLIGLVILVTTSSLFSVLLIGMGNILQISLLYVSLQVPFGIDEKVSLFFALLMTFTCSVVAYMNQKNVHRLRESETRRAQAESARIHQAKEAELARKALVNAEAVHRVQAAADVAHQVNNPLNYIQLSLLQIRSKLEELESSISHLLGHDESQEHELVRTYYQGIFLALKDPLGDADTGVNQVADAIAEVRSLSGVDGYSIESFSVGEILRGALEKLLPLVSSEGVERIKVTQNIPEQWQMRGNRYLTKAIVVTLLQISLEHSKNALQVQLSLDSHRSHFIVEVQASFAKGDLLRAQLAARLESLTKQSPVQVELSYSEDSIRLCHHLTDRPIVQHQEAA